MGDERFFRSRVSREKKKMKKKIKSSRKTEKSWHRIETSFKTATKQISANFKRPPKLRNAVQDKNGPRARWPRKVGGGGIFPPTPPNGSFPNGCGRAWLSTSHFRRRHRRRRRRCRRRSFLTCFSGNFARDEKQLHRRQTS